MSERILYFDCFSGLAGDMTLGAMVDLGLDVDALRAALGSLPVEGWTLEARPRMKMGIRGIDVHIEVGGETEGPAVTLDESGHGAHGHGHDEGLADSHSGPEHNPSTHDHAHHRHYGDIIRIIEGGALPPPVVSRAVASRQPEHFNMSNGLDTSAAAFPWRTAPSSRSARIVEGSVHSEFSHTLCSAVNPRWSTASTAAPLFIRERIAR